MKKIFLICLFLASFVFAEEDAELKFSEEEIKQIVEILHDIGVENNGDNISAGKCPGLGCEAAVRTKRRGEEVIDHTLFVDSDWWEKADEDEKRFIVGHEAFHMKNFLKELKEKKKLQAYNFWGWVGAYVTYFVIRLATIPKIPDRPYQCDIYHHKSKFYPVDAADSPDYIGYHRSHFPMYNPYHYVPSRGYLGEPRDYYRKKTDYDRFVEVHGLSPFNRFDGLFMTGIIPIIGAVLGSYAIKVFSSRKEEKRADLEAAVKLKCVEGGIKFLERALEKNIQKREEGGFLKKLFRKLTISKEGDYYLDWRHPMLTTRMKYLTELAEKIKAEAEEEVAPGDNFVAA